MFSSLTEFFLTFLFETPVNGYSYVFVNKLFKENFDTTFIRNIKVCNNNNKKKKKKIVTLVFRFSQKYFKIFSKLMVLSLRLDANYKWKLFHYSAYFCYYSWVPLHFLVLFMSLTVLFQLTFTFIYSTFSNKFSVSTK